MAPKDLFSQHAATYAQYRPRYPQALFAYLASQVPNTDCAWDCATGNGQAALVLSAYFKRIIATDLSQQQLDEAVLQPRIEYRVATAEASGLDAASVALVTVAQALHWFKHESFYAEVDRVLQPGGLLAVWCYAVNSISPELDRILAEFYDGTIKSFWEPERQLVDSGYATLQLPYKEIVPPAFKMEAEWDLEQYLGYLRTWSAVQKAVRTTGRDPLEAHLQDWRAAWGPATQKRLVHFPLALRIRQKV